MLLTSPLRIAVALAAAVVAFVALPLSASAVSTAAGNRSLAGKVTLQQVRAHGVSGARLLASSIAKPDTFVKGRVILGDGDREDARPYVLGVMSLFGEWFPVTGSEVATDGSYTLPLPPAELGFPYPAKIRVGFFDDADVYRDSYYNGVSSLESAADITVARGATVTGIDGTMTAHPRTMFSGTARFSEGSTPTTPPAVAVLFHWETDPLEGESGWAERQAAEVAADGTYRLHVVKSGTYRIGFFTENGVFSDVYYKDAPVVDKATDVTIAVGSVVTGLDQTMTANPVRRVSGRDRYETSVKASRLLDPISGESTIVLATGENWPDALVAGPYAAGSGAQLLLTRRNRIPASVAEEIRRLEPMEVVIIGGPGAVSLDVEMALRSELNVPTVRRIQGRDRYSTSAQVADEMMLQMGLFDDEEGRESTPTAVIVTGTTYADALSATPLAAAQGAPLLLTKPTGLPASVSSFMKRRGIRKTFVVGGSRVVGANVARSLADVTRLSGTSRYQTSAAVARYGMDNKLFDASYIGVVSSRSFSDGVVAGTACGVQGSALLLTDPHTLSSSTASFISGRKTIAGVSVYGGEAAVSRGVYDALDRLVRR